MKNKLTTLGLILLLMVISPTLFAQMTHGTFTVNADTISATTTGTQDPAADLDEGLWDYVEMDNGLVSTSAADMKFGWIYLINESTIPAGWAITGFCDNKNCRSSETNHVKAPWALGEDEQESNNVTASGTAPLQLHLAAPMSAANGQAIVKFQIRTLDQTDTITFILNKQPTGLSVINQNDARIAVYPNPANDNITVFTDKSLNAKSISVYNILGRKVLSTDINVGAEITKLNINDLAAGNYMIRVTNDKGNVITSRKLTKN